MITKTSFFKTKGRFPSISYRFLLFSFTFLSLSNIAFADTYRLEITEASCSLCTIELVKKFSSIKGVEDVIIEPQNQIVTLKLYNNMTLSEEYIKALVKEANLNLKRITHIKNQGK